MTSNDYTESVSLLVEKSESITPNFKKHWHTRF